MKITKRQLRKLIREQFLNERSYSSDQNLSDDELDDLVAELQQIPGVRKVKWGPRVGLTVEFLARKAKDDWVDSDGYHMDYDPETQAVIDAVEARIKPDGWYYKEGGTLKFVDDMTTIERIDYFWSEE